MLLLPGLMRVVLCARHGSVCEVFDGHGINSLSKSNDSGPNTVGTAWLLLPRDAYVRVTALEREHTIVCLANG